MRGSGRWCFLRSLFHLIVLFCACRAPAGGLRLCEVSLDRPTGNSRPAVIAAFGGLMTEIRPDIVILTGVANQKELDALAAKLPGVKVQALVNGPDDSAHVALISSIKPVAIKPVTDIEFTIKGEKTASPRGFIVADFDFKGYRFTVIGAELKDKTPHPEFNQMDIRRYEARAIKSMVTEIVKERPDANIFVLGNMNENCGMSPMKDLYNRRCKIDKRLFDPRPLDSFNTSWTMSDRTADELLRTDYALFSMGAAPEVELDESFIRHHENWRHLSSHRPVVLDVTPCDRPVWDKERMTAKFPSSIYMRKPPLPKALKSIGEKKARKRS